MGPRWLDGVVASKLRPVGLAGALAFMSNECVLFLCTNNSARSLMAEAWLRHYGADRFDAYSCGLVAKALDPMTLRVLEERGVDTLGLRSKPVNEYLGRLSARYAIIVCRVDESDCPSTFPFPAEVLNWPFENPVAFVGSDDERLKKFREVRDRIEESILAWLGENKSPQ